MVIRWRRQPVVLASFCTYSYVLFTLPVDWPVELQDPDSLGTVPYNSKCADILHLLSTCEGCHEGAHAHHMNMSIVVVAGRLDASIEDRAPLNESAMVGSVSQGRAKSRAYRDPLGALGRKLSSFSVGNSFIAASSCVLPSTGRSLAMSSHSSLRLTPPTCRIRTQARPPRTFDTASAVTRLVVHRRLGTCNLLNR